ncbi:MAG: glycosyltransferase [Verrucomicrobiia bacterium]
MDYSIIIPAYNEEQLLPRTLKSLSESMLSLPGEGEIIVVDNNSTDRTPGIARRHGARVVFEPINQISRARNAGARVAKGRYLLFVDADTIAPRPLLENAIRALRTGRVCGGGSTVSLDKKVERGRYFLSVWNWLSTTFSIGAGSFLFCLKEAFDDVNGFSEKVYAGEEIFFSRALKRWGAQRGYEFRILSLDPVVTSARKLDWFGDLRLLRTAITLMVNPWAIQKRERCWIWYKRPGEDSLAPDHAR